MNDQIPALYADKNYSDFGFNLAVVVSSWDSDITNNLYLGAQGVFEKQGAKYVKIEVPGSFELIYASGKLARSSNYDAILCIGCITQGETKHFDYVCEAVSNGLATVNASSDIPAVFCVLTVDDKQQAIDRAGGKCGNKGEDYAWATLEMARLRRILS